MDLSYVLYTVGRCRYLASLGLHLDLLSGDDVNEEVKHVVLRDCHGNITSLREDRGRSCIRLHINAIQK